MTCVHPRYLKLCGQVSYLIPLLACGMVCLVAQVHLTIAVPHKATGIFLPYDLHKETRFLPKILDGKTMVNLSNQVTDASLCKPCPAMDETTLPVPFCFRVLANNTYFKGTQSLTRLTTNTSELYRLS